MCFYFLVPKTEVMDKRLGSLVDEFKELVYPPDYNPEGKVTQRKKGKELGMDVQWVSFFFLATPHSLQSRLPVFSPRSFMVSGLTFKPLIHFEFFLKYGVRK